MYWFQWGNWSQGLGSVLIKLGIQNRSSVSFLGLTARHIIFAQGSVWTVYFSRLVLVVPLFPHPALLRTSFCSWQQECQHFINTCKYYIGINIHTCITWSRLYFYLQLLIQIAFFRYRILSSSPICHHMEQSSFDPLQLQDFGAVLRAWGATFLTEEDHSKKTPLAGAVCLSSYPASSNFRYHWQFQPDLRLSQTSSRC